MKLLKRLFALISIVLIFPFSLLSTGCNDGYTIIDGVCYGTNLYIAVKGGNLSDKTKTTIDEYFKTQLEKELSVSSSTSCINAFNTASINSEITLTQSALEIFNACKDLYLLTDGKFNPAVYPILKKWKLSSDTFDRTAIYVDIPSPQEIAALLEDCQLFNEISLENNKIKKPSENIQLDLGGIAKGYAVDKIVDLLKADGITDGYVNIGGSSIYIFSVEEDLKVIHPRKSGYLFTVKNSALKNLSLSTSGDYVRYYPDESGKYYSHLINPTTGYPSDGFASVTVIGKTAMLCDGLSTSLALMEKEEFISFVKTNLSDCLVYGAYIKEEEKLLITNDKQGNYTLLDEEYSLVIID